MDSNVIQLCPKCRETNVADLILAGMQSKTTATDLILAGISSSRSLKCKAPGCIQNHTEHHCIRCGNHNSDHKSTNCIAPKYRCKALHFGCKKKHANHYCKHCKDNDSDHKSNNCLKKICKNCRMTRESHNGNLCSNINKNNIFK